MKNILKSLAVLTVATPMLTGCIEETFPTSGVTTEQVAQSSKSLESIVKGMPAYMKEWHIWSTNAFDFGYPAIFIAQNVMTNDMVQPFNGYQHFLYWEQVTVSIDPEYLLSQINWYYLNFQVKAANEVIGMLSDPKTPEQIKCLAEAITYRSATYLDMARIYEFLPNATISPVNAAGNDVTGLTVPYVTPDMTSDEISNNPRLPHAEMSKHLLEDLAEAEQLFLSTTASRSSKVFPDLAVVYGLMARVYMWDENYPEAAKYARKAITTGSGYAPLTRTEWFDKTNGFNNSSFNSWMWAIQYENNDDAVTTGQNSNWASFMVSESAIGYNGQRGCNMMIDAALYASIDNADWRKLSWKAPAGSALSGLEPFISASQANSLMTYTGIKFRPGSGVVDQRTTTFTVAVPLMRIEEMYLIEAEATAQTNPGQGKTLLESFMQTYRYPTYVCLASDKDGVVDECFKQKRIEFWGENVIFYDYKRLNKGVTRAYQGSNWPAATQYNVTGRPGWMNWPFVSYESDFNKGVEGYLNPPVGDKFKPATNN
ncbi:MAG: RagB/SusD family nutrient uptake outer membrane protein [Paramuribaculum sp.]|nr:RagB/SusD family nutrient uptake outer membrane protein [Paramuribaculum sp.]